MKLVYRIIYIKPWLASGQSVFLVEESLHDESGLTPLLSCAKILMRTIAFVKKVSTKYGLIAGVIHARLSLIQQLNFKD
ncbi:hypothetical protein ACFL3G_00570, partial [Planctomycetota bacterium]